jgi:DtxR family Mn-dependent transcriptional regulator
MRMREELENILKNIWINQEEGLKAYLKEHSLLEELISKGYVVERDDKIDLTEKGKERAKKVVRLHRLAERLLSDVLGISESATERSACLFEHVLSEEVEEAICTLLGHPSICPHGRAIPQGKCCIKGKEGVQRLIFKLSELKPGDEAEVRYMLASEDVSQKTMAVGLLPGRRFKVIRVFPTYVIQIDNTHFALDRQIADTIYALKLNF